MTVYSEFHSVHLISDFFFLQPVFLAGYFQPFHHKPQAVRRMSNLFWNQNLSLKFDSCFFSPAQTFFISVILRALTLCFCKSRSTALCQQLNGRGQGRKSCNSPRQTQLLAMPIINTLDKSTVPLAYHRFLYPSAVFFEQIQVYC